MGHNPGSSRLRPLYQGPLCRERTTPARSAVGQLLPLGAPCRLCGVRGTPGSEGQHGQRREPSKTRRARVRVLPARRPSAARGSGSCRLFRRVSGRCCHPRAPWGGRRRPLPGVTLAAPRRLAPRGGGPPAQDPLRMPRMPVGAGIPKDGRCPCSPTRTSPHPGPRGRTCCPQVHLLALHTLGPARVPPPHQLRGWATPGTHQPRVLGTFHTASEHGLWNCVLGIRLSGRAVCGGLGTVAARTPRQPQPKGTRRADTRGSRQPSYNRESLAQAAAGRTLPRPPETRLCAFSASAPGDLQT